MHMCVLCGVQGSPFPAEIGQIYIKGVQGCENIKVLNSIKPLNIKRLRSCNHSLKVRAKSFSWFSSNKEVYAIIEKNIKSKKAKIS